MLELRRHKRVEMNGFRDAPPSVSGVNVLNLSMGGISVLADEVLNPGSEYSLKLRNGEKAIPVRGSIIWSIVNAETRKKTMPKYRAGLQFAQGGVELLHVIYFILFVFSEFIRENNALVFETLKKVKMIGVCSSEGQELLFSERIGMSFYLKRSDEDIYPILRRMAAYSKGLRRTLGLFQEEIREATDIAIRFFHKHSRGDSGPEFIADFGQMFMALTTRIAIEENLIFSGYENLFENRDEMRHVD